MTTPLNGAQVCIVHCTALGARLPNVQRLQRLLGGAGAAVTVVSEPEPNVADLDSLRRDVNLDPASLGPGPLADMFRPAVGSLHMRQISNFGKHLVALRRIAAAGPGWHLVLEDDALCADDTVVDQLARTLGAAVEADVLFLGLPSRTVPASPTSPPVFE
jgi:hypothetical protein